jgi:S-adenosylmethionine:tRNA ribosyltransferase-isomerase
MKTSIFDFDIPDELIAKYPSEKRSDSRLLVYNRQTDEVIDSFTKNISDFLDENNFLVFNNSRVVPARLIIRRESDNRKGELLVLKIIDGNTIEALMDKAKKYNDDSFVILPDNSKVYVEKTLDDGIKIIKSDNEIFNVDYFDKYGLIPLPPYIKRQEEKSIDRERYQTIYSTIYGSSAAPTAGLHFDDKIFKSLEDKKIDYAYVSLHVGLGTFKPIYAENIEDHKIHNEEYLIDEANARKINKAISSNKIIIPVGTTSLRTLETAIIDKRIKSGYGLSSLYIYPPYDFKIAGGLITNFHTPKSSLIVLVSAMIGVDKVKEIYGYAVQKKYRFFSYGDAMLIL